MSRVFTLCEQDRVNLNRRMKLGFCLIKVQDIPRMRLKDDIQINYTPQLIPRQSIMPLLPPPETIPLPNLTSFPSIKSEASSYSNPSILTALPQNVNKYRPTTVINQGIKLKNTERLKAIVQKFKKHKKFPTLTNGISKAGKFEILYSLGRIQEEIKKHMHTIDTFKTGVLDLLDLIKQTPTLVEIVAEIRVFFQNLIVQQKQIEFQTSLQDLQKNIDKITRQLGDTKEQGQWYYKKKKRNDKFVDVKEMIYICDLIRSLPKAYLIGVWEIIHEQPFREIKDFKLGEIDISTLKIRKIREIEYYVKLVLTTLKKSKGKKKAKLEKRLDKERKRLNELIESFDEEERIRREKREKREEGNVFTTENQVRQAKEEGEGNGEENKNDKSENKDQNQKKSDDGRDREKHLETEVLKQSQQQNEQNQQKDQRQELIKTIAQQHQPQNQTIMQVQQPPKERTPEQLRQIKQIEDRIELLISQLQVSSSDSSMITDDEQDFD